MLPQPSHTLCKGAICFWLVGVDGGESGWGAYAQRLTTKVRVEEKRSLRFEKGSDERTVASMNLGAATVTLSNHASVPCDEAQLLTDAVLKVTKAKGASSRKQVVTYYAPHAWIAVETEVTARPSSPVAPVFQ